MNKQSIYTLNECTISLDIGTTHIKAIAYTLDGKLAASATSLIPSNLEGIQSAAKIYEDSLGVLSRVFGSLFKSGIQPLCISISAAMHSILPVTKTGEALAPAMLWSNNTGQEIAISLRSSDLGSKIYAQTGTPIHPMNPFIKLAWMKTNDVTLFKSTSKFISIKEYVYYHLCGYFEIDYSIASSSGLFYSKELCWSKLALDFAGLSDIQLGKPVSPYQQQNLLPSLCQKWKLPRSFPIIAGASDGCLASLGAAPLIEGNISLSMGTSGALRSALLKFKTDEFGRTFTYLLDENHFIMGGPSNNAGNVYSWLNNLLTNHKPNRSSIDLLNNEASKIEPGANGLSFIPYLFGERAPLWDANASSSFEGLRNIHSTSHFARAVMEGIIFNMRFIFEIISEKVQVNEIHAGGGLSRSKLWIETISSIFNHSIHLQKEKEDSAAGAAIIALASLGKIPSITDQNIFYQQSELIMPNSLHAMLYEPLYESFKKRIKTVINP